MTLWTVARQAPLSMRFSRQEYWSELPCSSRGASRHRGPASSPVAPALQAASSPLSHWGHSRGTAQASRGCRCCWRHTDEKSKWELLSYSPKPKGVPREMGEEVVLRNRQYLKRILFLCLFFHLAAPLGTQGLQSPYLALTCPA